MADFTLTCAVHDYRMKKKKSKDVTVVGRVNSEALTESIEQMRWSEGSVCPDDLDFNPFLVL